MDAGCGSGRDSKHFIERDDTVTAFDASETMCECIPKFTGQEVRKRTFQEMNYQNCFVGIWASASLPHVPEDDLTLVLKKIVVTLKSGCVALKKDMKKHQAVFFMI